LAAGLRIPLSRNEAILLRCGKEGQGTYFDKGDGWEGKEGRGDGKGEEGNSPRSR